MFKPVQKEKRRKERTGKRNIERERRGASMKYRKRKVNERESEAKVRRCLEGGERRREGEKVAWGEMSGRGRQPP